MSGTAAAPHRERRRPTPSPCRAIALTLALLFGAVSCAALDSAEGPAHPVSLPDRPILMVHGALGSGAVFTPFRDWLIKRGAEPGWVSNPDFSWTKCMEAFAAEVGREVQKLRRRTGRDRVVLVCHSLGCGAVLSYVNLHGGARYASHVVTIAGDNYGAYPRLWGLLSCATRQMTPYRGAYVRRMFRGGETRPGVRYCALQAGQDWVLPSRTTSLKGAKMIRISPAGHASIVLQEKTFRRVAAECLRN